MPLVIDIETKSEARIEECGSWAYSLHPSTEVLCMVVEDIETGQISRIDARNGVPHFQDYLNIFIAHNIAFEYAIMKNVLGWDVDNINWIDTMDIVAYMGAPLSLSGAAEFLLNDQDANQKDKEGRKLMLKICTPKNRKKMTWHEPTYEEFQGLMDYCAQDVRVSAELYKQYKDYIPEEEWEIMADTQRMNRRGVPVDQNLIFGLIDYYEGACDDLDVPQGYVKEDVRSNKKMLAAIPGMPNVQAETVENLLKEDIDTDTRLLLEARQIMTMASVKKLNKLISWTGGQDRFRNGFQYHGAKTGRYAGRGPQPQNLPRGFKEDLDIVLSRLTLGLGL